MCGISGMIGLPAEQQVIEKMLATMHRRGPDDRGIYRDRDTTLLHARLAIIDIEGGRQPMLLQQGDETYVLIYNGELYNTEEIRHDLLKAGHCFSGHSDTEVLLHAYAEYGEACVERFNGIFALAVWESKRGRLFLARDRIGVKPLFYKQHNDGLLFASEIKTILTYPTVKPQLDSVGAAQLILLGPGRLPGSGVFHGIQEVEPGCCGYFEDGSLNLRRYWKLRDREHRETFEETSECVRYLVLDAIRRQMVSDVPIGTFLSGGLDSSIISAVCAREMALRGERLMTFSVDYQDNERYFVPGKFQPNADGAYIRLMQQTLATDQTTTVLSPEELASALEAATALTLAAISEVVYRIPEPYSPPDRNRRNWEGWRIFTSEKV